MKNQQQRELSSRIRSMKLDLDHLESASSEWSVSQCKDASETIQSMESTLLACKSVNDPNLPGDLKNRLKIAD